MRVVVVAVNSDTIFDRRFPIPLVPISSSQADSIRARVSAQSTNPERAIAWRSVALPPVFRPLKRVFLGADGAVWAELKGLSTDRSWLIISPDGKQTRTLTVPQNIFIQAADAARVWATESDDDGLESVVRFRIRN